MNSSNSGEEKTRRIITPAEAEFLADPHVRQMRNQHEAMLRQLVQYIGKQTDDFMEACVNLVFPDFVAKVVREFGTDPKVAEAATALMQAVQFCTEETANDVERMANARIRTIYIGPARTLVGRLVITMKDGKLQAERTFNDSLKNNKYSAYDACVRLFLWTLCNIPCSERRAKLWYQIFFGREPEATAGEINYSDNTGVHQQDSEDRKQ